MSGLIRFFLLAYGISWTLWAPLWGPAAGIHGLPVLPFNHALGGLGPMLAALICTGMEQGSHGVRAMLSRMLWWKPIIYFLIALLAPFEKWPSLAECDLRYWKPNTLGDALFNWWD